MDMYIIFLILGFALLVKGADFLVQGASSIAKKLKISELAIGLTVVAFGTSAPELLINDQASLQGNSDIALGNILGSNIANILLILGIASVIHPLTVRRRQVLIEIPIGILSLILTWILGNNFFLNKSAILSQTDGLIMIFFFVIFLIYTYKITKIEIFSENKEKTLSTTTAIFLTIIGLISLPIGGEWVVESAVKIATSLGVSKFVIAATIIAIGTSLPELATSMVAAHKKKSDIVIGNIVGSNIFNTLWILGLSATIRPIKINSINNTDILIATLVGIILFSLLRRKRFFAQHEYILSRWTGITFLILYTIYLAFLILRSGT